MAASPREPSSKDPESTTPMADDPVDCQRMEQEVDRAVAVFVQVTRDETGLIPGEQRQMLCRLTDIDPSRFKGLACLRHDHGCRRRRSKDFPKTADPVGG